MIRARKIRSPLRPRSIVQREGTPVAWRRMQSAVPVEPRRCSSLRFEVL